MGKAEEFTKMAGPRNEAIWGKTTICSRKVLQTSFFRQVFCLSRKLSPVRIIAFLSEQAIDLPKVIVLT